MLSHFMGGLWTKMFPVISLHTHELPINESLIRKTLCWYSFENSSLHMSMHIKLYKWPTQTSHTNARSGAGATGWHTPSPAPKGQLHGRKLYTLLNHDTVTSLTGSKFYVLLVWLASLSWGMWIAVLGIQCWNKHSDYVQLLDQITSRLY